MKKEDRIRLEAADLLLDRGMRFTISDAPVLIKAMRMNRFNIRPLKAGTIIEIVRLVILYELESVENEAAANGKLAEIAEVVAVAILNDRKKIKRYTRIVKRLLLWKVTASTLFRIYFVVSRINKVSDFMTITGYFADQAQAMMNPKLPGQSIQGS